MANRTATFTPAQVALIAESIREAQDRIFEAVSRLESSLLLGSDPDMFLLDGVRRSSDLDAAMDDDSADEPGSPNPQADE